MKKIVFRRINGKIRAISIGSHVESVRKMTKSVIRERASKVYSAIGLEKMIKPKITGANTHLGNNLIQKLRIVKYSPVSKRSDTIIKAAKAFIKGKR